MGVKVNSSGGGSVHLVAPSTASDVTLELPTDSVQPGLVLVASASFTAQASVSVDDCFSGAYDNYLLLARITGSSNQGIRVRMRAAGTDDSSANYGHQYLIVAVASVTGAQSAGQTSMRFGQVNTSPFQFHVLFGSPAAAVATAIDSSSSYIASAVTLEKWAGAHNVSTAYDGFTVYPDSGTITGTLSIYGYRKA